MYPKNIDLIKIKTLEDAKFPQEDKYPSGRLTSSGLMFEHTKPKVGESFYIYISKLHPKFRTSKVLDVKETEYGYIIKTLNSIYKIKINGEQ